MKAHVGSLFFVVIAACGGSDTPVETPTTAAAATEFGTASHADGKHEGGHEHDFPAVVTAFHDAMAPLWHGEPGDARTNSTCDAVPGLREKATAITSEPIPEKAAGKDAEWSDAAAGLVSSVDALETACAAEGRVGFEDSFKKMHEAFHVLVALVGHEE